MSTVQEIQDAAHDAIEEYSSKIDSLTSSLTNAANSYHTLNNPLTGFTIPPLETGALNSLVSAAAKVAALSEPTPEPYPPPPLAAPSPPAFTPLAPYVSPVAPIGFVGIKPTKPTSYSAQDPGGPPAAVFAGIADLVLLEFGPPPILPPVDIADIADVSVPAFTESAPTYRETPLNTTFSWSEGSYKSAVLDAVTATVLDNLLNGGYGINTSDEQQLWERARERETLAGETAIAQATRLASMRGFSIPPGALMALIEGAQQASLEKISSVSREIALKRADMYVENRKFTIQQSVEIEKMLIAYYNSMQERALKYAQATVEVAINVYNALAQNYRSRVEAYKVSVDAYNAFVQASLAPLEVAKLKVEVGKAKLSANQMILEVYKTEVSTVLAKGEINKQKLEISRLRLDADKANIDGYSAKVQAFKALIEAKGIEYQGYAAEWDGYKASAQAYAAEVQGYAASVDAAGKEVEASARVRAAEQSAYGEELKVSAMNVTAYGTLVQAVGAKNTASLQSYSAKLSALGAQMSGLGAAAGASGAFYNAVAGSQGAMAQAAVAFMGIASADVNAQANTRVSALSSAIQGYGEAMKGLALQVAGVSAEITSGE